MTDCGVRSFWFSVCLLISKAHSWHASCRVRGAQSYWVGLDPRAADWEAQGVSERVSAYWWVGWQRAGLAERTRMHSEWLCVQSLGSNDGCLVGCPIWHLWYITGRRVHFPNLALASLWVELDPGSWHSRLWGFGSPGADVDRVFGTLWWECCGAAVCPRGVDPAPAISPGVSAGPGAGVSPLLNGTWAHVVPRGPKSSARHRWVEWRPEVSVCRPLSWWVKMVQGSCHCSGREALWSSS